MNALRVAGFAAALSLVFLVTDAASPAFGSERPCVVREWLVAPGAGPEWAAVAPDGGLLWDGGAWRVFRCGDEPADLAAVARREAADRPRPARIAAHAFVFAPRAVDAALLLRCEAPVTIFSNGEEAARRAAPSLLERGPTAVPLRLRAGWNRLLLVVGVEGPGPALVAARIDAPCALRACASRPDASFGDASTPRVESRLELRPRAAPLETSVDAAGRVFVALPVEVEAAGDAARSAVTLALRGEDGRGLDAPHPPPEPLLLASGERRAALAPVPIRDLLLATVHGAALRVTATSSDGGERGEATIDPPSPRAALRAFFAPAPLAAPDGLARLSPEPLHAGFATWLVVDAEAAGALVRFPGEAAPSRRVPRGAREEIDVVIGPVTAPSVTVDDGGGAAAIRVAFRPSDAAAERHLADADAALAIFGATPAATLAAERDACAALAARDHDAFERAIAAAALPLAPLAEHAKKLRVIRAAVPRPARDGRVPAASLEERIEEERRAVERAIAASGRRPRRALAIGGAGAFFARAVAERYPDLAAEAREAVAAGALHVIGGAYADLGASPIAAASGETLARQFLVGQRALLAAYGETARVAFVPRPRFGLGDALPDGLPQILAQAGVDSLLVEGGGPDLFDWTSSDGSSVLVARAPVVPARDPLAAARAGLRFAGSFGGLEEAIVIAADESDESAPGSATARSAAIPRVETASSETFFAAARRAADDAAERGEPSPYGERRGDLALEESPARFASPAARPRDAARLEPAVFEAETLATLALALGDEAPSDEAAAAIESFLLAGSAGPGRENAAGVRLLEASRAGAESAASRAVAGIAARLDPRSLGDGLAVVAVNALAFDRTDAIEAEVDAREVPGAGRERLRFVDPAGRTGPVETVALDAGRVRLLFVGAVPATGYAAFRVEPDPSPEPDDRPRHGPASIGVPGLFPGLTIDPATGAVALRDASGRAREAFRVEFSRAHGAPRIETRSGSVAASATVRFPSPSGESRLDVRLAAGLPGVDATLSISPGGTRARLVVPADTLGAPTATAGGPFRAVALRDGEWFPFARGFATLAARGRGATTALLFRDTLPVRLDVASAALLSEMVSDAISVRLTVADPGAEGAPRLAAAFASPLRAAVVPRDSTGGELPPALSFLGVEPANVLVAAVKPSEDRDSDVVIRLVETAGRATTARLAFAASVGRAASVDLLERDTAPLAPRGISLEVELPPGAVRTVRVPGSALGGAAR